jgi:hypothetical protein
MKMSKLIKQKEIIQRRIAAAMSDHAVDMFGEMITADIHALKKIDAKISAKKFKGITVQDIVDAANHHCGVMRSNGAFEKADGLSIILDRITAHKMNIRSIKSN